MNWDQLAGQWKQYRGKIRQQWGRLTDDDLDAIAGRRDQLIGRLQERYGMEKEAAERQVGDFLNALEEAAPRRKARAQRAGHK